MRPQLTYRLTVPWDATDYDVLIPAFEGALLYMRGHLCFFLARQETETKLNEYPTIRTMQAYIDGHHPWYAAGQYLMAVLSQGAQCLTPRFFHFAEEGEYSAFVLRSPSINFLILTHHLVELMHQHMLPNTAKLSTLHGAYKMQWPGHESLLPPPVPNFPVLDMPRTPSKFTPTFSEQGATHPVELQESTWPWDVWIPKEHVNSYDIDWNFGPDGGMRMVGRGGGYPGGSKGVWERVEPSRPIIECHALHHSTSNATVWLIEGLYVHFFEEKHNGRTQSFLCLSPHLVDGFADFLSSQRGQTSFLRRLWSLITLSQPSSSTAQRYGIRTRAKWFGEGREVPLREVVLSAFLTLGVQGLGP